MPWLALAFATVTLLLFVPVRVQLELQGASGRVTTVRWAGLRLGAGAADRSRRKRRSARKAEGPESGDQSGSRAQARRVKAILFSAGFLSSLVRFCLRLLRSLRPYDGRLSLTVGLGDPASTGRLLAALSPLLAVIAALDSTRLELTPDFLQRCLNLEGRVKLRVVPGVVLLLFLGYAMTAPPWRALIVSLRA